MWDLNVEFTMIFITDLVQFIYIAHLCLPETSRRALRKPG